MNRRECPNCGVEAVLSGRGVVKVYSGTPSWSDIKKPFERFQANEHTTLFCVNCYNEQ